MAGAPQVLVCTSVGGARGADAAAAAVAVAHQVASERPGGAVLLDARRERRPPRGTMLASVAARELEAACGEGSALRAAARGRLCFAVGRDGADCDPSATLAAAVDPAIGAALVACVCDPPQFRVLLDASDGEPRSALLKSSRGDDRALSALVAGELLADRIPVKVWAPPIGAIPARRALAGLEPGGESGRRALRFAARLAPAGAAPAAPRLGRLIAAERAQALPAVLGIAVLVVALAVILLALGSAATAKGRMQRSADLAALSAARSMRDDFDRLFVPARLANGLPNPAHLEVAEYLDRARMAALEAAERNGIDHALVEVGFPDEDSFAPLRVRVHARGEIEVGGEVRPGGPEARVSAEAEVAPPTASVGAGEEGTGPAMASGGGYGGPLAYRQGKPMRPDAAAAFDRMAAAAAADGVSLVINSGYRSDAEQAALWEQNPDPRMVAPPGTSLHRCGTELDLGPATAYDWLAANAGRFGFLQRYSCGSDCFGSTTASALAGGRTEVQIGSSRPSRAS